jgi:hypothetical protein
LLARNSTSTASLALRSRTFSSAWWKLLVSKSKKSSPTVFTTWSAAPALSAATAMRVSSDPVT